MFDLLDSGVHLIVVVDLFPPGPRDLQGIYEVIRGEVIEEPFGLPRDKPLAPAAYEAGAVTVAHVEFTAVGDDLPTMPPLLAPQAVRAPFFRGDIRDGVERVSSQSQRAARGPPVKKDLAVGRTVRDH
jgi:hypothetical protein